MLSNVKKNTRSAARPVQKDVMGYRIILFSVALLIAVLAVMMLKNSSVSTSLAFYRVARPILIPLFALATAGAAALWISRRKKGIDESGMVCPASLLTVIGGGYFAVCVGYALLSATRLLVCLIAVAALFYIYYLYPRSFFAYAGVTLVGGLLLAFLRFGATLIGLILPAVLLAGLEVILLLMLCGRTPLGKFVPATAKGRLPFLLTAALLLVGLVLGLAAPALLFWAIALLFASFLVIAIITTLRLM